MARPHLTEPPTQALPPVEGEAVPAGACVGVIDLGSNSVRLVVAEIESGQPPRVVAEEREPVRLGENVFHTGQLNLPATERTLVALQRFSAVAKARGVTRLLARATCALREAEDRQVFLDRVREKTGIEVQVLTGADEARMIARGILSGMPDPGGEWAFVDIGGGSVEISRSVEGTVTDVASLKLGAVRLTEMFLRSDPPTESEIDLLRAHARTTLRTVITWSLRPNARLMGSAGTINALTQLIRQGKAAGPVSLEQVENTVLPLARMPLARRRNLSQLDSKRADIIVAGGLVLLEVMRHLGAKEMEVTRRGLKDGLLLDAVESLGMSLPSPTEPERIRLEGAMALVRRFRADEAHATQVAALAGKLFLACRSLHELGEDARTELEAAALLHDIGQFISFERHHRHSAYLIAHSPLPGFSDAARIRLATMARYHRKALPSSSDPEWAELPKADRSRIKRLAALLRVADALDRSHHHVVKDIAVEVRKKEVILRVFSSSALEMESWAAVEKADLFEKVYERKLRVEVVPAGARKSRQSPGSRTERRT